MILALDVGNTHIVMGCIENGEIRSITRIVTNVLATESEYAIKISQILEFDGIDCRAFEGAILSSVVPPVTSSLKTAVTMLTGFTPIVVGAGIKTGLNIKLDDPSQMGADLVAGAVGAISEYGAPLIILDMGTATTFSVVGRDASFLGGAIVPGVNLSINALATKTSLLHYVSVDAPKKCIATNTADSMKSGAIYGHAALIDGMIDRISEELGESPRVIATGGLASSITPFCRHKITCDDDLLLKGLWILYQKNKK
jgi:type III pantothenate kinase